MTDEDWMVSFGVRLPIDLREWVDDRADEEGISSSELARKAIRKYKYDVEGIDE